jgi:predicted transcriptional regulator
MSEDTSLNAVELATELTIAWLGNQNVRVAAEDVPAFLRSMHATVTELSSPAPAAPAEEASVEHKSSRRPSRSASRWRRRTTSSR